MRILQPSAAQLASAAALSVPAETGLSASEVAAEIEAGRIRPEWSVLAIDESGAVIGRAMWWGRDTSVPIALDVWDVDAQVPGRGSLAKALLNAGHEALSSRGVAIPLPHTMRLPNDWRDHATVVAEVDLKTRAAAAAGLTRVNERLQFQWDADRPLPPELGSLVFAPADDDTFVRLFAAAAEGSLDVMTRRELESSSPDEALRRDLLDGQDPVDYVETGGSTVEVYDGALGPLRSAAGRTAATDVKESTVMASVRTGDATAEQLKAIALADLVSLEVE